MKGIFSQIASSGGSPSPANTTTSQLGAAATFTGEFELNNSPDVMVVCQTDQAGKLYFDFSVDGVNFSSFPPNGFDVAAGVNEVHNAVKGPRYFRVRFTNTSVNPQTYLRLYTYYGSFRQLNAPLNSTISPDADSIVTRSVLMGQTDGGMWQYVPVDYSGHLEVAVHSPRLPFGSIHTESLTPIYQVDGVYGINQGMVNTTISGSGSVDTVDSSFRLQSGVTIYSQGVLLSRKRLRYRPGQGVVSRFTAKYDTPVANSYQIVGVGHSEDGVYFGYGNTSDLSDTRFGILYVNRGVRATYTLTMTVRATSAGNVTITLNGTAYTVALTNSTLQANVWEIATATYAGWDAYADGATVVFVRKSSGTTPNTFSYGAGTTGSAATIAQTKAGAASTDVFIPQEDWNGDKLDGTGPSGVLLDPTKGNVFQIKIQYLGYGGIVFEVENAPEGNNPDFITVHTIQAPNSLTKTTFGNPSFPFTAAVYSAGSTTNLNLQVGSLAGFVEGAKVLQGNRFSYFNFVTTANASTLTPLFTIMNRLYYGGRANQAVINLLSASGAVKHTQPVIYFLIKNGTLTGPTNFAQLSSNSCSLWDTASTTITYSNNNQLIWTGHLGETGEIDHHFGNGSFNAEEVTLQPGEWFTLAVKSVANNVAYVTGAINTREDQ